MRRGSKTRQRCLAVGTGLAVGAATLVSLASPAHAVLAPSITVSAPFGDVADAGWWFDVSVVFTVNDNGSPATLSGCGLRSVTVDSPPTGTVLTCTATNAGGSSSLSTTVFRDATSPVVTATPARPFDHGTWYHSPISFSTAGVDPSSGIAGCSSSALHLAGDSATLTYTGSCTDVAGNPPGVDVFNYGYDATPPTVTVTPARPPDHGTWYTSTISFAVAGTDVTAGIESCDGPLTHAPADGDGVSFTLTGHCTDKAGNTTPQSVSFAFDATAPSVAVAPDRAPDQGTWYRAPVTFTTSGVDAASGVSSCTAAQTHSSGDGAGQSVNGSCTNGAGLTANAAASFDYDATAPTISASVTGSTDALGRYLDSAVIHYTCGDATSGVASCPADLVVTDTGTYTGAATDQAGNTASTDTAVVVLHDDTPPVVTASVSPAAAPTGWWNIDTGAPTATFTCNDGESGVATCPGPVSFGEGAGQTVTVDGTDLAGNTGSATVTVDVDLTAPDVNWNGGPADGASYPVTALPDAPTCAAIDAVSGPATCDVTGFSTALGDHTLTATATDIAGNTTVQTHTYSVVPPPDSDAPVITPSVSPARPGSGWWNIASGAPTVSFTCDDGRGGSGVASCPTPVTFGEGIDQSVTVTASDNDLNIATLTVGDIDVDLTGPGVTWLGGPAAGGSYVFGSVPAGPSCAATDALSGPGSCSVSGYSAAVGAHTLVATSSDAAGNITVSSRSYTVTPWTLVGFDKPLDPGINTLKAGHDASLRFEVFAGAAELTSPSVVGSVTTVRVSCADTTQVLGPGHALVGPVEYKGGRFRIVWVAPDIVGACYQATVTTLDGSSLNALFMTN